MEKIAKALFISNLFHINLKHTFTKTNKDILKCSCGGNLLSKSNSKTNRRCSLCNKSYILVDENTLIEP